MQDHEAVSRLERLKAALQSLQECGTSIHAYATPRGELITIENQILTDSEVIDLFEKGELTREGIWKFLAAEG
jgi:predicted deacetylase